MLSIDSDCDGRRRILTTLSIMPVSSLNPMFDHLLELSHQDDSNKWSNIGFGKEMGITEIKIRTSSGALTNGEHC